MLKLVFRGELVPSGKFICGRTENGRKEFRILIPKTRDVLGYVYADESGELSYESTADDAKFKDKIKRKIAYWNSSLDPRNHKGVINSPSKRAIADAMSTGNQGYANPRWEHIDWDEETANGDPN